MEFPSLGKQCHHGSCKQLDFLPIKCDACEQVFCRDHVRYDIHHCPSAYKKDVQVPVCPLCNTPVPVARGELPDIKVGEHIDRFCQSDPAVAKRKAFVNRCSVKGCKKKELVPIVCNSCRLNYCLRHRNELDHDCKGFDNTGRPVSSAGAAALGRVKGDKSTAAATKPKPSSTTTSHANNSNLNEDEALALALQMSLSDTGRNVGAAANAGASTQEDEDRALALALQQSEREYTSTRARHRSEDKKNCIVT